MTSMIAIIIEAIIMTSGFLYLKDFNLFYGYKLNETRDEGAKYQPYIHYIIL